VSELDQGALPPTQYLIIDVLAARARVGERMWTFPRQLGRALRALEDAGWLDYKSGVVQDTYQAWLTDEGRAAALYDGYTAPSVRWAERAAEAIEDERLGARLVGDWDVESWRLGMTQAARIVRKTVAS
jgi:hypothetical protein